MKNWFIIDLVAVFPWRRIGFSDTTEYYIRLVRILRMPDVLDLIDEKGLSILINKLTGESEMQMTI